MRWIFARCQFPLSRVGLLCGGIALLFGSTWNAEAQGIPKSVQTLIDVFISDPPTNKSAVEKKLSTVFTLAPSTVFANYYEGKNVRFRDVTITEIDYRESIENGTPRGRHLGLELSDDSCISKSELLKIYGPMKISGGPEHGGSSEQWYFSKQESWGNLSFGFQLYTPDCLKTILFLVNTP